MTSTTSSARLTGLAAVGHGTRVLPVVAGKRGHHEADKAIRDLGVWRVVNGRAEPPRSST